MNATPKVFSMAIKPTPRDPNTCPKCGTTERKQFAIHGGQSTREDCAQCGYTFGFPLWYGKRDAT